MKNQEKTNALIYFFPSKISEVGRKRIQQKVEDTKNIDFEERASEFRHCADEFSMLATDTDACGNLRMAVAYSILSDLIAQGWKIDFNDFGITVESASFAPLEGETVDHAKKRIRAGLQIASNRQLGEASVQDFIERMERERPFKGKKVSILSLIDNGVDLATALQQAQNTQTRGARINALGKIVRPVLQECATDARCEFTGLKLQDIWRYFRYTWSLEYNPLPGRTQRFLLRNGARKNNPVIGIAMLASPTANLGSRDKWIGWQIDALAQKIMAGEYEAAHVGKRLLVALENAIKDIRHDDLITDDEIAHPTFDTLIRLDRSAAEGAAQRKRDLSSVEDNEPIDIRGYKKEEIGDDEWRRLSETGLFRKKRAEQLAPLIKAMQTLVQLGIRKEPAAATYLAFTDKDGQSAVRIALNEIKKRHLATEVADLAVCGAIAPYNTLLSGKLVALAMASREARKLYCKRYSNQVSEIASQIAGRSIVRSSDLKLITTTSLYGVGSNQYSSLALRRKRFQRLNADVVWKKLESGTGVSITHLSEQTVTLMRQLGTAVYGRRRINSVFGEGSSPRMRQIREGLNLLGINDDSLLKQSHGRKVYGCELYENAKDDMLGFGDRSKRRSSSSLRSISNCWIDRWLSPRIDKPGILEATKNLGPHSISESLKLRAVNGGLVAQPSPVGEATRSKTLSISDSNSAVSSSSPALKDAATVSKT
jgi:hypothetical protein